MEAFLRASLADYRAKMVQATLQGRSGDFAKAYREARKIESQLGVMRRL